jgi:hypothetical protein
MSRMTLPLRNVSNLAEPSALTQRQIDYLRLPALGGLRRTGHRSTSSLRREVVRCE